MGRSAALLLLLASIAAPSRVVAQTTGWIDVDLGSGHRARRYLPTSVRTCDALPLLLFLHGAGGTPEAYEPYLTPDAETLGLVLVLPLSTSTGWSDADVPVIDAALAAVNAELVIDDTRTYIGGHSAGGAFAYLLAYGGTGLAAVFTMSAPYYSVTSVAEPTYRAPIHMYYGDMDPNYTGGGAAALESQWTALGIPHETDLEAGYDHSTWPASSIRMGYDFLLAHRYPGTPTASTCGGDAGAAIDAATSIDGAIARADAGGADDAATSIDGALTSEDAGPRRRLTGGCGCQASSRGGGLSVLALVLGALAAALRLRSSPRRSRRRGASSSRRRWLGSDRPRPRARPHPRR